VLVWILALRWVVVLDKLGRQPNGKLDIISGEFVCFSRKI